MTDPDDNKRVDDLDSIVDGSPSNGQIKMYLDSKSESSQDIEERINKLKKALKTLQEEV